MGGGRRSEAGWALISRWVTKEERRRIEARISAADGFAGEDLRGFDFRGLALPDVDFERSALDFARFDGCRLPRATLHRASLRFVSMMNADLTGASLRGADLVGGNWAGARLVDTRLEGADLRGAVFSGADLTGAQLVGATTEGADFENVNWTAAVGQVRHGRPCGCLTRFEREYLACLRPHANVVTRIADAVDRCPAAPSLTLFYLASVDWRLHAVAAVMIAAGALSASPAHLARAWRLGVDESWASPQLLAALYLVDPDFPRNAVHLVVDKAQHAAQGLLAADSRGLATSYLERLRRAMPGDRHGRWVR